MSWETLVKSSTAAVARGRLPLAEEHLKQAFDYAKRNFHKDDDRLASTLSFLGQIYFVRGMYAKSKRLLEQSLRANVKRHTWNEPCIFMDLFVLAEIKKHEGALEEAALFYDRVLRRMRPSIRSQSGRYAIARFAELLRETGIEESALAGSRTEKTPEASSFELDKPVLPEIAPAPPARPRAPDSLDAAWLKQCEAGRRYLAENETESAVQAYINLHSALTLAWRLFPPEDMRIAENMLGLGLAANKLHMYDLAERLYFDALRIAEAQSRPSHSDIALMKSQMACLFAEVDRYEEAEEVFRQTLDLKDEVSPVVAEQISATGLMIEKMRRRSSAAASARQHFGQAQTCMQQGEFDRANKACNNAISALRQAFPPTHTAFIEAFDLRAAILAKMGQQEQAAEFVNRARRIERSLAAELESWVRLTQDLPEPELKRAVPAV